MGLFDFLGGGSKKGGAGGKGNAKLDKLVKKLTNPYVQTTERQRLLHQLAAEGSVESLHGLLQRFTYRTDVAITDQDEKELAYELLLNAGPAAVPAIERFVGEDDNVYWPLKALREIAGAEMASGVLLRALDKAEEAGADARRNDHKTQLVSNLRDFPSDAVRERLETLCGDPDEEVRIMAADGLMTYGEEVALPVVAARLASGDETLRVKTVVLEQLHEAAWDLNPHRETLEAEGVLPGHYRIDDGGKLQRG